MSHLIRLTSASNRSKKLYIEIVGDYTEISDVYIEGNLFSVGYIIREVGKCVGWDNIRYINYWRDNNFLHLQVINKNLPKNLYKTIRNYMKNVTQRCNVWQFHYKAIK